MSESINNNNRNNHNSHLVTLGNGDQVISLLNPNAQEFIPTYAQSGIRSNCVQPQLYSNQIASTSLPLPASTNYLTEIMTADSVSQCVLVSPETTKKEAPEKILNCKSLQNNDGQQDVEENLTAKMLIKKWSERINFRKEDSTSNSNNITNVGASSKFGSSNYLKKSVVSSIQDNNKNQQQNSETGMFYFIQENKMNTNAATTAESHLLNQVGFSNQLEQMLDNSQLMITRTEMYTKDRLMHKKKAPNAEISKGRSKDEKKERNSFRNKIHKIRARPPYTTWSEVKKIPLHKLAMHCKSKFNSAPLLKTWTKFIPARKNEESIAQPVANAACEPKFILIQSHSNQSSGSGAPNSNEQPSSSTESIITEQEAFVDSTINVWPYISYKNWSDAPLELMPRTQRISLGDSTVSVWPIASYKKWSDAPESVTDNPKHLVTNEATVNLYPIATYQKWSEGSEDGSNTENKVSANSCLNGNSYQLQQRPKLCSPKLNVPNQSSIKQPEKKENRETNPLLEAYQKWMLIKSEKLKTEITEEISGANQQSTTNGTVPSKAENTDTDSTKAIKPYLQEFIEDLRKRIIGERAINQDAEALKESVSTTETPTNMLRLIKEDDINDDDNNPTNEPEITANFDLRVRPSNPKNVPQDSDSTNEEILKLFMGSTIEAPSPDVVQSTDDGKKETRPPSVIEKDLQKVAELLEEIKIAQIADDMGDFVNAEDLEVQRILSQNVSDFEINSQAKIEERIESVDPVKKQSEIKLTSSEKVIFFDNIQINKVSDSSLNKVSESATTTTLHSKAPPASPIDKRLLDGIPPVNIKIKSIKIKKPIEKKVATQKTATQNKKAVHIKLPSVDPIMQNSETASASISSCTTSSKTSSGSDPAVSRTKLKPTSSQATSNVASKTTPKTTKKVTNVGLVKPTNISKRKSVPSATTATTSATNTTTASTSTGTGSSVPKSTTAATAPKTASYNKKKPSMSLAVKPNTTARLRSIAVNKAVSTPPITKTSVPSSSEVKKPTAVLKSSINSKTPITTADKGTSTTKMKTSKKPQIRDTLSSVLRQSEANKRRHLFLSNESNEKDNILVNDYLFK